MGSQGIGAGGGGQCYQQLKCNRSNVHLTQHCSSEGLAAVAWEKNKADPLIPEGPPERRAADLSKVTLAVRSGRGHRNPQRGIWCQKDLKLEADGVASKGNFPRWKD